LGEHVVLRNEEDLFGNLLRGGDVDLLVGELEHAERTLIRHLGVPVRILRSSYVTGYSYEWGHIDLLPVIEWRGARFLPTSVILRIRRTSARGRPVPRIAHEALISWLTTLLFGGFFKERYAATIAKAVVLDGNVFRQTLIDVAGKTWGVRLWQAAVDGHAEISANWTRSLRRAIWWRACFRAPVRTVHAFLAFVIAELTLRIRPPVPWVTILGESDSAIPLGDALVDRFDMCPYGHVKVFHSRPRLLAEASSGRGAANADARDYRRIGARVRPFLLAAEWLGVYWTRLVHLRAKGYIVTFDRVPPDAVSDIKRWCDGTGWPARALRRLFPQPDIVFVLSSESDIPRQAPGVHVLDRRLPVSVLADEVQERIRTWMADRSAASLDHVTAALSSPHSPTVDRSSGASCG